MVTAQDCIKSLIDFELKFHKEIYKWIEWKMSDCKNLGGVDILDFSWDNCVFSFLLKTAMKGKSLTTAVRGDQPTGLIDASVQIKQVKSLKKSDLEDLASLGTFDLVVVNDVVYEMDSLTDFLIGVRKLLRSDDSRIFILIHPKNPPPPLPDVAMSFWRKIAPKREEIIRAIKLANLGQVCYSISCPIQLPKQEWYNILKLRTYHALRQSAKCTDKEIRNFVSNLKMQAVFEEKMITFLVTPKPEQGDKIESELEPPSTSDQGGDPAPALLVTSVPMNVIAARRASLPGAMLTVPTESASASGPVRQRVRFSTTARLPASVLSHLRALERSTAESEEEEAS